ncbi:hypothetical protein CPB84DRAFT_1787509, partial [Gymnopilus junonius]
MGIGRCWNWTHQWWYSYLLIWSGMDAAARSLNEEAYTHKKVNLHPPLPRHVFRLNVCHLHLATLRVVVVPPVTDMNL